MAGDSPASGLIVTIESRRLKRTLGPLAWAVLEDVSLDAVLLDGRWLAATSTRRLADHLGLTPGTAARALARLCTEGLVRREDRRDTRTGRFGESVYVVAPTAALLPCVERPHTVRRTMDAPNTVRPVTVSPGTAPPSEALPPTEDQCAKPVPSRRLGSPGRRQTANGEQQLLLGDGEPSTTPMPAKPPTTTTTKPQQPNAQIPTTQNPKTEDPHNSQTLNPTTQRTSDTCQLSQAGPGRASC